MEEPQQQAAGAVGDAYEQRASAPERDLRERHGALDGCVVTGPQFAERHDPRAVLVAGRQMEQQILDVFDA